MILHRTHDPQTVSKLSSFRRSRSVSNVIFFWLQLVGFDRAKQELYDPQRGIAEYKFLRTKYNGQKHTFPPICLLKNLQKLCLQ